MRLLVMALWSFSALCGGETKEVDYCVMLGRAEHAAARTIEKRYGFQCTSKGSGAMCLVRDSSLMFHGTKSITIEEARRIVVDCCEIYLDCFNSYPALRPYLFEYPFPISRIGFSYYINEDLQDKHPEWPLAGVSVINGIVSYYKNPLKTIPFECTEETYEEAKKIIEQELQGHKKLDYAQKRDFGSIPRSVNSDRYTGPIEDRNMKWIVDAYAKQIAKRENMQFHKFGNFSDSQEVVYGLTFFDAHEKDLEEARQFTRTLVVDYLDFLRKDSTVLEYQKEHTKFQRRMRYPPFISDEIMPYQLGVKIGYWDKDYSRPKSPKIAQIVFMEGMFRYYEADPKTEALKLVLEESFDDTQGKVKK